MKNFKLPWINKSTHKADKIEKVNTAGIDQSTLDDEVRKSNAILSGKIIYMSDTYSTLLENERLKVISEGGAIKCFSVDDIKNLCKSKDTNLSIIDLVIILSIPKTEKTDLFRLFSTTPELRIVYSDSTIYTHVLTGSTIQGYKDLILNTKNQINPVLSVIKNLLYENFYSWMFTDLIELGCMTDTFIDPGVDCFWEDTDTEVSIDDESLDKSIKDRIERIITKRLNPIEVSYCSKSIGEVVMQLYNIPDLYKIYINELRWLGFNILDVIKVFGFNYDIDGYCLRYSTIYDMIHNYGTNSNVVEYGIVNYLLDEGHSLLFGSISISLDSILAPPCIRHNLVELDDNDILDEAIEDDLIFISDDDDTYEEDNPDNLWTDENFSSGGMPILKFDADRYKSTRLSDEDSKDEASGKYDL